MIIESIERPVLNPEGVILFLVTPAYAKLFYHLPKADTQFTQIEMQIQLMNNSAFTFLFFCLICENFY